jgi:hypothetical protein
MLLWILVDDDDVMNGSLEVVRGTKDRLQKPQISSERFAGDRGANHRAVMVRPLLITMVQRATTEID